MGSGASKAPVIGVATNPRVEHAQKLAKASNTTHLIDAPVLVDLPQGTVRYRYFEGTERQNDAEAEVSSYVRIEANTEGPHKGGLNLQNKAGYFFHAKLADYSTGNAAATLNEHLLSYLRLILTFILEANKPYDENDYRYKYVFHGPRRAKNKYLFYVTGSSLKAPISDAEISSYPSRLNSPVWPHIKLEAHHAYYNMVFVREDTMTDDMLDNRLLGESDDSRAPLSINAGPEDAIESVKEKVSMYILKPVSKIHIFFQQKEIRPGVTLSVLDTNINSTVEQLTIKLTRLD